MREFDGLERLGDLPPFLRVLLVTDGTVTRSLEAYFLEPIAVVVLQHDEVRSAQVRAAIGVASRDPILLRRVLLRGERTRTVYAYADSAFALARIPAAVRDELVLKKTGVGEILRSERIETRREIRDIRRGLAGEAAPHLGIAAGTPVLERAYRIALHGHAAIEIRETFPIEPFR